MIITFRRAIVSDAKKLIEVQNRSFYDDFIAYGECPAYQETEEQMEKHINERIVYVIEYENEVVGDLIIRKKSDERLYLRVICVVPEYHNLGIGYSSQSANIWYMSPKTCATWAFEGDR